MIVTLRKAAGSGAVQSLDPDSLAHRPSGYVAPALLLHERHVVDAIGGVADGIFALKADRCRGAIGDEAHAETFPAVCLVTWPVAVHGMKDHGAVREHRNLAGLTVESTCGIELVGNQERQDVSVA
jgi:hypothetical protein